MNDKLKGAIAGLLLGATLTGSVAFAKTGTETLDVWYNNIKLYVDGQRIDPKDTLGNPVEPFIINGTTYLPVRAVGEALGKEVNWDGNTSSVYLGVAPEVSQGQYLTEVCPAYQSSSDFRYTEYPGKNNKGKTFSMGGKEYTHGGVFGLGYSITGDKYISCWAVYNLNKQYTTLNFDVGPNVNKCAADAMLRVYCDGILKKEIELSPDMIVQNVTVDLASAQQLKIVVEFDPRVNEALRCVRQYAIGNPIIK